MTFSEAAEIMHDLASEAAEREKIIKLDNEMRAHDEFFETKKNLEKIAKNQLTIFRE